MSESKMKIPQKWWWVAAVAVPLLAAVVAIFPDTLGLFVEKGNKHVVPSGVVIKDATVSGNKIIGQNSYEGAEINTQVALVFDREARDLSPEQMKTLQIGIERLENGDFSGAIPMLRELADSSPTPEVYNDLAAAYLATSEPAAALEAIKQARSLETGLDAKVEAALNWNERRLLQTQMIALNPIGSVNSTNWDGFDAFLTRAEETGGMVTVEIVLRNSTTKSVIICPDIEDSYVIDERTGESWANSFNSDTSCTSVDSGAFLPIWAKFAVNIDKHPHLTIVVPEILPFDNIAPVSGNAR